MSANWFSKVIFAWIISTFILLELSIVHLAFTYSTMYVRSSIDYFEITDKICHSRHLELAWYDPAALDVDRTRLVVYRLEPNKTRWSCPYNSGQNCTQSSAMATLFVCLKLGLVQLFSDESLSHLQTNYFITTFACLNLCFWCQSCQLFQDFTLNRDEW